MMNYTDCIDTTHECYWVTYVVVLEAYLWPYENHSMLSNVHHSTPHRPYKYMNLVQLAHTNEKLSYIIEKFMKLSQR